MLCSWLHAPLCSCMMVLVVACSCARGCMMCLWLLERSCPPLVVARGCLGLLFVRESCQEWPAPAGEQWDGAADVPVPSAAAIGARQPFPPVGPPPPNLLFEASTGSSSSPSDLHKEARVVVVVAVSGVTLRCQGGPCCSGCCSERSYTPLWFVSLSGVTLRCVSCH
jgi:hypothetical protein